MAVGVHIACVRSPRRIVNRKKEDLFLLIPGKQTFNLHISRFPVRSSEYRIDVIEQADLGMRTAREYLCDLVEDAKLEWAEISAGDRGSSGEVATVVVVIDATPKKCERNMFLS
jgi:hypothetical protein